MQRSKQDISKKLRDSPLHYEKSSYLQPWAQSNKMEQLGTHFCKQMAAHSYIGQEVVARWLKGNLQCRSYLVRSKERKSNNVVQSLQNNQRNPSSKMPLNKHRDIVNFLCLGTMSPYHQEDWATAASVGRAYMQRSDLQLLLQS